MNTHSKQFLATTILGTLTLGALALCGRADDSPSSTEPLDAPVLNAVLSTLITYDETDRPLSLPPDTPRAVYFSAQPAPGNGESCPLSFTVQETLSQLPQELRAPAQEANVGAVKRASQETGPLKFSPTDQHIIVMSDTSIHVNTTSYQANYPIAAWPPGYSEDRRVAVVKLYFPALFHPSMAVYVLTFTNSAWHVVSTKILTLA